MVRHVHHERSRMAPLRTLSWETFLLKVCAACANFRAVYRVLRIILALRRQERKVTGQVPSSQTNVRDLRRFLPSVEMTISPLSGHALRETMRFGWGVAARGLLCLCGELVWLE